MILHFHVISIHFNLIICLGIVFVSVWVGFLFVQCFVFIVSSVHFGKMGLSWSHLPLLKPQPVALVSINKIFKNSHQHVRSIAHKSDRMRIFF